MSAFDPPDGDLAAIKAAAALFATLGTELTHDRVTTQSAVAEALADWHGERYQAFISAGAGVQEHLRVARDGCHDVSAALTRYASVFQSVKGDVAEYAHQAAALRTKADGAPAPPKPDPLAGIRLAAKVGLLETDALDAKFTLLKAASSAAQAIDAITSKVAPVSSALTPEQIRRQVNTELGITPLSGAAPGDTLTPTQALALLGAAQTAVPLESINADGSVDWIKADALPPVPPAGTSPVDVATWWQRLSPTEQNAELNARAGAVGNLDGVPVIDRDFANRKSLPVLQQSVQAQLDALKSQEPSQYQAGPSTEYPSNADWDAWNDKVQGLQHQLDGLNAVDTTLFNNSPAPMYLVGLQNVGNGRAIIATGNPDTSANVSTFVPGMGTKVTGISGDVGRSNAMYTSAQQAGSSSTAAVTWYGYDAPPGLSDAASYDAAKNGAPLLDRFQDGLRATHEGAPSINTVIAHSYGTTVAGMAASHGNTLNVDNIVFVASPGTSVDHASDLHLTGVPSSANGQHVYATVAEWDPIRLTSGAGTGIDGGDPTYRDYGGHVFQSDAYRDPTWHLGWWLGGWNSDAHSSYWNQGNPSLRSMGRIIAGQGA